MTIVMVTLSYEEQEELLATHCNANFHTNLQTALDKVERHHCCMCDAATQDTPKPTQGIVLCGAKIAAHTLCDRREGTHTTCNMQGHMQHWTKNHHCAEPYNGGSITTGVLFFFFLQFLQNFWNSVRTLPL